jgi:hypothetical protein
MLASNDDWQTGPDATIPPTVWRRRIRRESALLATLPSRRVTGIAYTAIVSGVNGTTGVAPWLKCTRYNKLKGALVEAFDIP